MKHKLYFILLLVLVSVFSVNVNIASASRVQAAKKTYEPPAIAGAAFYNEIEYFGGTSYYMNITDVPLFHLRNNRTNPWQYSHNRVLLLIPISYTIFDKYIINRTMLKVD